MDNPILTDIHLQQYRQDEHHHHIASQAYDPSQVQSYYTYPYQYDHHQHYPYPSSYTNIYQQHHETTSIHPPGVPIPPKTTTHLAAPEYVHTHLQNHQNAYYPQGVVEQQYHQSSNSNAGGLNPAAAAFPQWQGNDGGFGSMPAQDGSSSLYPPIGQPPYRGGGRRGGGSHGHGRGRGSGKGSGWFAPAGGPAVLVQGKAPQAASGPGQVPFSASAQVHATQVWPPCMAWCELCRVDCNTLEILEQHKNGKKHKKNLQRYEELQNLNKQITEMQYQQISAPESKPERVIQPENQPPPPNLPSGVSDASVAEPTEEPEKKGLAEGRGRGTKRMMRGGRGGGKRARTVDPPRPSKQQVIPLICHLCNVKCESQVVFESHLAGKKHLSSLKKLEPYQAILGAAVLQALCQQQQQNPNDASSSLIPQLQQAINFVPGMLPQFQVPAPVPAVETQDQLDFMLQASLPALPDAPPMVSNDVNKTENGISEVEGKETSLNLKNHVVAPLETTPSSSDQGVLQGLDCKTEEPELKNEEPTE